jgi:hypothetical protein
MNMSAQFQPCSELLEEVDLLVRQGNFDVAAQRRTRLLRFIELLAPLADDLSVERVIARARIFAVEFFLSRMEIDEARKCLSGIPPADAALLRGDKKPIGTSYCLTGFLNAALANLMFRQGEFREGYRIAQGARALLAKRLADTGGFHPDTADILEVLANAWAARLAWRVGGMQRDARSHLDEQMARAQLLRRNRTSDDLCGFDLALAILLDMAAEFDASIGRTDMAAIAAQFGVMLLREGATKDRVRLGHLLYVMGKIEARRGSHDNYRFALQLLANARKEYFYEQEAAPDADGVNPHPFRFRAMNQQAQCMVRANQVAEALDVLDDITEAMQFNERQSPRYRISDRERDYLHASVSMTRLWIHERRARIGDRQALQDWQREAKAMTELANLSVRLRAESHLQLGVASSKLGEDLVAEQALTVALEAAGKGDIATIQIAALLALAETLHRTEERRPQSLDAFKRASLLLESRGVGSTYLLRRRDEVAGQLRQGLTITIAGDSSYVDAERQFRLAYVSYHAARAKNTKEFEVATGVPRPTLLRWVKELGASKLLEDSGLVRSRGRGGD